MAYTGSSVVDYLKSTGKDSSFASRKLLAEQMGIPNYSGTSTQNTQFLNSLRNLLTKPEGAPKAVTRSLTPVIQAPTAPIAPTGTREMPPQTPIQQPATPTPQQAPQSTIQQTIAAMLKAAQGAGNEDLQAKRNAIIQARFNAQRQATPEELRILSPQQQASLRGLDVSGLEEQLGGVSAALKGREAKTAAQLEAGKTALSFLQPKEVGGNLLQLDPETGEYKTVYQGTPKEDLPPSAKEYEYAKKNGFVGSYNDYQNMDANRRRSISNTYVSNSGLNSKTATRVQTIAGQFDNEAVVKNFNVAAEGKEFADSLSDKTQNPADDQGLIYALAKALDPGSVVREGEYATAQKYSQSWIKAYGKGVEQAINGTGFLSEEARRNIKKTIASKFAASKKNYDNIYSEYGRRINKETGQDDGTDYLTNYGKAFQSSSESSKGFSVTTPDGKLHSFPSQAALDSFKKAAKL